MTDTRQARCGCGELSLAAQGELVDVYACTCLNCQRKNGAAFTYYAVYPDEAVMISGERKVWRYSGDRKRWIDSEFRPD